MIKLNENLADKPIVLLVDDDPIITDTLGYFLKREFTVLTASRRKEAISLLRQAEHPPVVALIDLGLPPSPHTPDEGFALIATILAHSPKTRIIVLSGQNEETNARHARTLGATDFISKPANPETILELIHRISAFDDADAPFESGLIGSSAAMQSLKSQIKQFAPSPFPVLIEGESGSGKELIAAGLHHTQKKRRRLI